MTAKNREMQILSGYFISIVALFLCAAVILALPGVSCAASKNMAQGVGALSGAQADAVYFGAYQQSEYTPTSPVSSPEDGKIYDDEDGTKYYYAASPGTPSGASAAMGHYYKIEPIKWRVLSTAPSGKKPGSAETYGDDEYGALSSWKTKEGLFLFSDTNLDAVKYNDTSVGVAWETCFCPFLAERLGGGRFLALRFLVARTSRDT